MSDEYDPYADEVEVDYEEEEEEVLPEGEGAEQEQGPRQVDAGTTLPSGDDSVPPRDHCPSADSRTTATTTSTTAAATAAINSTSIENPKRSLADESTDPSAELPPPCSKKAKTSSEHLQPSTEHEKVS